MSSTEDVETKAAAKVLYKLREQASANRELARILSPTTEVAQALVHTRVSEIFTEMAADFEEKCRG